MKEHEKNTWSQLIREFYDQYNIKERYGISYEQTGQIASAPFLALRAAMMGLPQDLYLMEIGGFKVTYKRLLGYAKTIEKAYKESKMERDKFEYLMRQILQIVNSRLHIHSKEKAREKVLKFLEKYEHLLY